MFRPRMTRYSLAFLIAGGAFACSTTTPKELHEARQAYREAANSRAADLAPARLDDAKKSLARAESHFEDAPRDAETRDWAYIAKRQAQLAVADANAELARRQKTDADRQIEVARADRERQMQQQLNMTSEQLAELQRQRALEGAQSSAQLEMERRARLSAEEQARLAAEDKARAEEQRMAADQARMAAENAASQAMADLKRFAEVKEDERGTIITLTGSLIFASGKSALLPTASEKLDKVSDALKENQTETITVTGYTDSVGSESMNQELSLRRAQTVRDYLISRGVPAERMRAIGLGESSPIADNTTAEGRANNRRVEIVLSRPAS